MLCVMLLKPASAQETCNQVDSALSSSIDLSGLQLYHYVVKVITRCLPAAAMRQSLSVSAVMSNQRLKACHGADRIVDQSEQDFVSKMERGAGWPNPKKTLDFLHYVDHEATDNCTHLLGWRLQHPIAQ